MGSCFYGYVQLQVERLEEGYQLFLDSILTPPRGTGQQRILTRPAYPSASELGLDVGGHLPPFVWKGTGVQTSNQSKPPIRKKLTAESPTNPNHQ